MDFFIEKAATEHDAEQLVRRKYGDRAKILSRREVRSGGVFGLFQRRAVEVTGYCPPAAGRGAPRTASDARSAEQRGTDPRHADGRVIDRRAEGLRIIDAVRAQSVAQGGVVGAMHQPGGTTHAESSAVASQSTVASNGSAGTHVSGTQPLSPTVSGSSGGAHVSTGTTTPPGPNGNGAVVETVLAEIRELKQQLSGNAAAGEPAPLAKLRATLLENDFSADFADRIVKRARNELSLEAVADSERLGELAVLWIGESVRVFPWKERKSKPHVVALVGPTGVGKTTTIAKLAAMYGAVATPSYDVRIFTIDSYRIGAYQQIQKYGEIMGLPVRPIENPDEMRKQMALNRDADFIFVDTIGKSPRDFAKLAEVNELVTSAQGEVHLALSATTKYADMLEILRQFEPFDYKAVVITKLDETSCVGGIISALHERQKALSFLTDGQSVPQDISRARVTTLLRRLHGLPVRQRELEERFDDTTSGSRL